MLADVTEEGAEDRGGFIETPEKESYLKRVFLIFPSINQFQTVGKKNSTVFHLKISNTSRSW